MGAEDPGREKPLALKPYIAGFKFWPSFSQVPLTSVVLSLKQERDITELAGFMLLTSDAGSESFLWSIAHSVPLVNPRRA